MYLYRLIVCFPVASDISVRRKRKCLAWEVNNSADGIVKYFFLFFPEKKALTFYANVSSNPIFWKKKNKKK